MGEAWGEYEQAAGEPFVGPSGQELNRMLVEAGILRSECFVTNLVNQRPPNNDLGAWIAFKKKDITSAHVKLKDKWVLPVVVEGYRQLQTEVKACQPNLIIAFGNAAMWALTGEWGILKWRGSLLGGEEGQPKIVPTVHPAAILREWRLRAMVISDLRRARRELETKTYTKPELKFIIRPSFKQVYDTLIWLFYSLESGVPLWLDFDLETRAGHIACAGLSWSSTEAICIPFMDRTAREGYWLEEEEAWIIWWLWRVLTHSRVRVRWHNGLYDAQYTFRHWHWIPRGVQDTMISQHAIFSDLPKSLAFAASMYVPHHRFWKEDK